MKHSHPRANEVLFCTLMVVAGSTVLKPDISHSQASSDEIDSIVVSAQPIRDSLERSLEVQRDADNLVSVMAADTIGRFPDSTAAAALARLPAVAVQRDQGQERYLQVRGAPARGR